MGSIIYWDWNWTTAKMMSITTIKGDGLGSHKLMTWRSSISECAVLYEYRYPT